MAKKPRVGALWENGIDHEPAAEQLMKLLRELDRKEDYASADLFECGGDGDTGETIMYYLDVLIRDGKVKLDF